MTTLLDLCERNNTTIVFVSHDKYLRRHFTHSVDIKTLLTCSGGN
jgi:ABC-type lipoprotein export system ATPase subunit